jgi:hypothetical protein
MLGLRGLDMKELFLLDSTILQFVFIEKDFLAWMAIIVPSFLL